jgi:ABC-2 type transport system permease protein
MSFSGGIIWTIARRELLDSLRNRGLLLFGAVICLLFLSAGAIGLANHKALSQERNRLQEIVEAQWKNAPDRHPHRMAHFGSFAFRPKSTIGYFDFGVDGYTGNSIFLEAHRQNPANFSEARHSSGLMRFGELSMAMVLECLVPLLIIFSTFNCVTKEREQHTLPLLVCQGITPRQLLAGKFLGASASLAILLVGPALVTTVLTMSSGSFIAEDGLRLACLGTAFTLYFGCWIAVSVAVSARQQTSSAALMNLLAVWALLVILVPKVMPNIANHFLPAPTKPEFDRALHTEVAALGNGHDPKDPSFEGMKRDLMAKHKAKSLEELPVNFNGVTMREGEKRSAEAYSKHFESLHSVYRSQNHFSEWAGLLDPYLSIRHLCMAVAGTDSYHFQVFAKQAEAHRFSFVDKLNQIHVEEIKFEGDKEQKVDAHHWEGFPPFRYQQPSLAWALANVLGAPLSLFLWAVLSIHWALSSKIEVRL